MDVEERRVFREELLVMRKAAKLCQEGLARRLGISQGTISCYERGITPIPRRASQRMYQGMCANHDVINCDEYVKMQQECEQAFRAAEEATERLNEFWGTHIADNWQRGGDGN